MIEILLIVNTVLIAAAIIILLTRKSKDNTDYINDVINKNAEKMREDVAKQIASGTSGQFERFDVISGSLQSALRSNREETNNELRKFAEQTNNELRKFAEQTNKTLKEEINALQKSNEQRLDEMRGIVDEKLQKTLNDRLTQSFEAVAEQLKSVESGLGEMKNLAADAKSLKNALTNVKERGTYGEVRLERLLSDIMTPSQYGMNVEIANGKRVEFVIYLPGTDDTQLLLPIDSKFPIEDYNRLIDAEDKAAADAARKSLAAKLRAFAKDIHDKYILPPKTTDFALMFLPTEGLYAETVRDSALFEELRDKYKVTPVGATTLSAFLASLQMGFKTLAVEQNAQGIMKTLGSVKSEFVKFGGMLEKAQDYIHKADSTISDLAGTRTRAINRALREVTETDERILLGVE
ncbi:MAG: DNA recombination protein RmuC [Ruminococcus sp.]|jgi:DNA recombination protein RmuC|nr:DNA recombination protein RmuC [Ruminococcus sp.]